MKSWHFLILLWNRWPDLKETWKEPIKSSMPSKCTKFCFIGLIVKPRWLPCRLICWDIFNFFLQPLNRIQLNFTDLNVLYQFCVFGPIGKQRLPSLPLIGRCVFGFSSATGVRNLTKLYTTPEYWTVLVNMILKSDLYAYEDPFGNVKHKLKNYFHWVSFALL